MQETVGRYHAKLEKQEETYEEKLPCTFRETCRHIKTFVTHLFQKQIEDRVYSTLSSRLGKRDFEVWGRFENFVNAYEATEK